MPRRRRTGREWRARTEEHQPRRAEAQHVRTPRSTHITVLSNPSTQQKDAQTRFSDERGEMHVVGFSQDDDLPMVVTERRRNSRPRLPVDDDEESDGAQAEEEPLAGSRVRTGLVNVDTGTTRRRSVVVISVSRRTLIEDDEARRHSTPV